MNERELVEAYVPSLEWEVGDWENVLRRALEDGPRHTSHQLVRPRRRELDRDAAGWGTRPLEGEAVSKRDERKVAGWGTRPL